MSDVDALRDRLIAERLTARTAAEILAAVARVEYYNRQYNAGARTVDALTCSPALAALTPADLAAWLPETTIEVRGEVTTCLADALISLDANPLAAWPPPGDWPPSLIDTLDPQRSARAVFALAIAWLHGEDPGAVGVAWLVVRVHTAWKVAGDGARHPLAPLVAAWQAAHPIERDRRPFGILPDSWRRARYHDHLPLLQRPYPEAPGKMAGDQHLLPLAELETPSVVVPALPLALYDSGAGPLASRGRGAPYAQRLFVEILLDVGRLDRVPGQTARMEVPLRELVAWLWPKRWQRTRSGDRPGDLEQLQHGRCWNWTAPAYCGIGCCGAWSACKPFRPPPPDLMT